MQATFSAGVATGEGRTFEHRMRHKDGTWSTWRATYRCEPRPGGVFALRGISQNITELAAESGFEIKQNFFDSKNYYCDSLWQVK